MAFSFPQSVTNSRLRWDFGDEFVLLVPVQVFRVVGDGHVPADGSRFPEHSEIGKVLVPLSVLTKTNNGKVQANNVSSNE